MDPSQPADTPALSGRGLATKNSLSRSTHASPFASALKDEPFHSLSRLESSLRLPNSRHLYQPPASTLGLPTGWKQDAMPVLPSRTPSASGGMAHALASGEQDDSSAPFQPMFMLS